MRTLKVLIVIFSLMALSGVAVTMASGSCSIDPDVTGNHVDFTIDTGDGYSGWLDPTPNSNPFQFGVSNAQTNVIMVNGSGTTGTDYPGPGSYTAAVVSGPYSCSRAFNIGQGSNGSTYVYHGPQTDNAVVTIPDWMGDHAIELWGLRGAFPTFKDGMLGIDNVRFDLLYPGKVLTIYDTVTGQKHDLVVNNPSGPKDQRFCLAGSKQTIVFSDEGFCALVSK